MKLSTINVSDINMGSRVRENYGDIDSLVVSFRKEGIIQPLAVMETPTRDKPFLLLAGGRRFTAARKAKLDVIPVRIYERALTKLEIKGIELAENLYRKDLDWQEEVKLKKEIHDLQVEVHGEKVSTAKDALGWSKRDTSKILNESPASTAQDIQLAEMLVSIPELLKCKNKHEAQKIIKKAKDNIIYDTLAQQLEEKQSTTPTDRLRKDIVNSYIIQDFFSGIKKVPEGSVDIVEIDPPYGIDLKDMKKATDNTGVGTSEYNEVEAGKYEEFMKNTFKECYRVMNNDSWIIVWFGPEPWFESMFEWMIDAGFKTRRIPGIWNKGTGQTMQPNLYLANTYEMFFYGYKGGGRIKKGGRANVFNYKPVSAGRKIHPTERPIEMIQEVLSTFGSPGDRVLVPYLGSGNTLLASANLQMTSFGYDLSKEYKDRFITKVHESKPPLYTSSVQNLNTLHDIEPPHLKPAF